jgi:two-component system, OmpR family, response regulator MtrA
MTKKLLVIDDQSGITKVVELIARQLGLNAKSLNSSELATETFIAFRPDVLMLDMIMPEKDGIDVLNEILLTGIPVKVVVTSGFSDSSICGWPKAWRSFTTIPTFPSCASRSVVRS